MCILLSPAGKRKEATKIPSVQVRLLGIVRDIPQNIEKDCHLSGLWAIDYQQNYGKHILYIVYHNSLGRLIRDDKGQQKLFGNPSLFNQKVNRFALQPEFFKQRKKNLVIGLDGLRAKDHLIIL